MKLEVQIEGDEAFEARRRQIRDRAASRAPFDAIGDDFLNLQEARFHGAAGWKPLSEAYARRKARAGRSIEPLVGGVLEKSVTRRNTKYSVRRIEGDSIVMGTRDPVAHLHQDGTKGASGKGMPARPVILITAEDRQRWRELVRSTVFGTGPVTGL